MDANKKRELILAATTPSKQVRLTEDPASVVEIRKPSLKILRQILAACDRTHEEYSNEVETRKDGTRIMRTKKKDQHIWLDDRDYHVIMHCTYDPDTGDKLFPDMNLDQFLQAGPNEKIRDALAAQIWQFIMPPKEAEEEGEGAGNSKKKRPTGGAKQRQSGLKTST